MAVVTQNPTSDDAVSGSWTGTAGSRYTLVNDYPDTTDFLTHGTTAGNITFGFSAFSIPAGSTINSVTVYWYDRKNASQPDKIAVRLKIGGAYYNDATEFSPSNGSWTQRSEVFTTNPATGSAWTVNDVNGTGAGALQAFGWWSSDASPAIDLGSIQIEVDYTQYIESRRAFFIGA